MKGQPWALWLYRPSPAKRAERETDRQTGRQSEREAGGSAAPGCRVDPDASPSVKSVLRDETSTLGQPMYCHRGHVAGSKPLPTDDSKPQLVPSSVRDNQARSRRPATQAGLVSGANFAIKRLTRLCLRPSRLLVVVPSQRRRSIASVSCRWDTALCHESFQQDSLAVAPRLGGEPFM